MRPLIIVMSSEFVTYNGKGVTFWYANEMCTGRRRARNQVGSATFSFSGHNCLGIFCHVGKEKKSRVSGEKMVQVQCSDAMKIYFI